MNWTKYESNPVLDLGPEQWDATHVYTPTVIYESGIPKMWYSGQQGSSSIAIGYAVVSNSPPIGNAGGPYSGDEGSAIALNGASASDDDGDPLSYSWTVDSLLCSFSDAATLNPTLTCEDNDSYTVTLTVSDGINDPVRSDTTVTVKNVAPTIDAITGPVDPININDQSSVSVAIEFSDPGTADTHDVTWDWGDTNSDTQINANSPASQAHTYSEPGVYAVEVTVTDDDGGSATQSHEFIVIYDPDGGFVTGGGWIDSPAGAYADDPLLEGKANFGFVSKYKKGQSVPTGNTEFNFKAGNLNFHSSTYEWLVVDQGGTNAQYKGDGTINGDLDGNGNPYKFMIWAKDDAPELGDTFRIKIWWEIDATETVVYDNGFDQAIGGGNIKIHDGNGPTAPAGPTALTVHGTLVTAPGQLRFAQGLADTALQITVKHLATGETLDTFSTGAETTVPFTMRLDPTKHPSVKVGDLLQVTAQSPSPYVRVEPLSYTVTADDINAGQIHLPELVVYEIPKQTELVGNYPNPFNPETWFAYRLAFDATVTLTIYDLTGSVVRTFHVGHQSAAVYESKQKAIYWNGRNQRGERVASGTYFYQFQAGDYSATRKMLILK